MSGVTNRQGGKSYLPKVLFLSGVGTGFPPSGHRGGTMDGKRSAASAEGIRTLYQQMGPVLAANVVNGGLVVAALWGRVDLSTLLAWGGVLATISLVRAALWGRYLASRPAESDLPVWGCRFTLGSVVSAVVWGASAILFVRPDDPISLVLMAFVLGGMAAGAMTALGSYPPAYYLYLGISVLPMVGRLLSFGDRVSLTMGGMLMLFVVCMVVIGRNYRLSLTRRVQLARQNAMLLANMEEQIRQRTADLQASNSRLREEVAERRRAEAALETARAEAERANKAKSRFLAAASHDLRQPMQAMFLFCRTLRNHLADRRGREALVMLERGLDILKNLLDSLLDVSRLDVNVIHPEKRRFALRPVIEEIAASFRPIAASKGLAIRIAQMDELLVESDRNLLGRILRNLVENAVRYTEQGGIEVGARLAGATARIEVRDSGIGIPADQLEWIFEEFHQVDNPERDKARGLGLGLSIVQRLATILGHRVDVRSEPGKGSVFAIEVPGRRFDECGAETAGGALDETASGHGRMVVLVDDDAMVLLGLRSLFQGWGYEVVIAGSTDEACGHLQNAGMTPALVIADYRLRSGRVGSEAIERIRAIYGRPVPGIILTGDTGIEFSHDGAEPGFRVVHKPVTSHQLADVVEELIGRA